MPRSLSPFTAPCPSTSAAHKILLSWLFVRKRFVRECFSCSPASIPDIVCSLICLINCDGCRFPGEPADGTYADHLPVASPAMISVVALIQGTKVISSSPLLRVVSVKCTVYSVDIANPSVTFTIHCFTRTTLGKMSKLPSMDVRHR